MRISDWSSDVCSSDLMSLLDCPVGVLANQAMNFLASGQTPRRLGNAHPNIAPYQTFAAEDGPLIIAVGNDGQFAKLCCELGLSALLEDGRFSSEEHTSELQSPMRLPYSIYCLKQT